MDAALDTQAAAKCRHYFSAFLPSILGERLIEGLKDLDAVFEIAVSDSQSPPWNLVIGGGRLIHVGATGPTPRCRFTLDAAALLDIVSGELPPQEAFFALRIEIEGDIELGLKLSTVLQPFFQRFPFARRPSP